MAEITIHLRTDPQTGARVIRVGLVSDEDALPQEHERLHRGVVARLFPGLDLGCAGGERVTVERERPAREPVPG
jgi:hypothetical protein